MTTSLPSWNWACTQRSGLRLQRSPVLVSRKMTSLGRMTPLSGFWRIRE